MLRNMQGDPIKLKPVSERRQVRPRSICQELREWHESGTSPLFPADGKPWV